MASLKGKYPQTLKKEERLSGKKSIELLFQRGKSIGEYPLKVIFLQLKDPPKGPNRVMFSVPRKNFKKSTERNLLKRRMREAYRKNKHRMVNESAQNLLIAYIYIGTAIADYHRIEESAIDVLNRLNKIIKKSETPTDEN